MEFNPIIKAVQTIKKLVVDVKKGHQQIVENGKKVRNHLQECGVLFASVNDKNLTEIWLAKKQTFLETTDKIGELFTEIETKLKNRDASKLSEIWEKFSVYKTILNHNFQEMKDLGEIVFIDENLEKWNSVWNEIFLLATENFSIAETHTLKLAMIEKLKPEEIDELTQEILNHLPYNYTDEEAHQYEQDYIKAYNELKAMREGKKNLWDKILDILAGGLQETPAQRVKMMRWIENER